MFAAAMHRFEVEAMGPSEADQPEAEAREAVAEVRDGAAAEAAHEEEPAASRTTKSHEHG